MNIELSLLKKACSETSQVAVARKIGYSPAVVNLVLKGTYKGDLNKVYRTISVHLSRSNVSCPILGDITTDKCTKQQRLPFSSSNSHRSRMFKACLNCPLNTKRKDIS